MQLFAGSGYSFQELLGFDTVALSELFSSHTTLDPARHNELMLYFEGVNKARNHPGFTFLYHYQQYVELAAEPYCYTQFLEHFRRKYPKEKVSMKLQHVAGEEIFINFAGSHTSLQPVHLCSGMYETETRGHAILLYWCLTFLWWIV